MKNKLIILIFLFVLLTISGCSGGKRPAKFITYTGSEGVTIEFPPNLPPDKIYEGESVVLFANIWNKGVFNLHNLDNDYGVIQLDFDPLYFEEKEKINDGFSASGRSTDWPNGETILIPISKLLVKKVVGTRESPTTTITASVCYPYETTLSTEVCIDSDLSKAESNPVCRNEGIKTFTDQGAPIAITKIESDMIPISLTSVQPVFRIKIKNVGKGLVLFNDPKKDVIRVCDPNVGDSDVNSFNVLQVSAWLGSESRNLKCTPEKIRLWKNEGEITCTTQNGPLEAPYGQFNPGGNYVTLLTVKVEYVYRNSVKKDITINRDLTLSK